MAIEGAEREALKGARSTLERFRPRLLIDASHLPKDPTVLSDMLRDVHADYRIQRGPCLVDSYLSPPKLTTSYVFFE